MKYLFQKVILLFIITGLYNDASFAQADYNFRNAELQSGTPLQNGAVYKFPNVKAGLDALVTITNVTGGITLSSIDENWTGFDEAFQPFINVSPNSDGYVEFKIDFVTANTNTLVKQGFVPVTCVDVDGVNYGNGTLYEKDQVEYIWGYYDFSMTSSNLQILNPPGWITIRNTSGFSYAGVDTVAKDVMATVVNANITGLRIRIGAQNTSPTISEVRYRSVYFKKFNYLNSYILPNRTLLNFSGTEKNYGYELKGTLSASHTFNKMIIERGNSAFQMEILAEKDIGGTNSSAYSFTYFDNNPFPDINFYRIRLVNTNQNLYELSKVLSYKRYGTNSEEMKLYNTVLNHCSPELFLQSNVETEAVFKILDISGKVFYSSKQKIFKGTNSINLSGMNTAPGYYILTANTPIAGFSHKILIQ